MTGGQNDVTIKLGLDDTQLPAPIQRTNAAIASIGKTGEISARQTAAAMRTLPAQFTDIATQLAGGQNPLLILLQQGGQIKDSFGGIGPAIGALRTFITPVAVSLTGLAASVTAAAVAAIRGQEEFNDYRRAILLTGNEAGVTVGKLDALARSASGRAGGTQGNAAGVAAQLAGAGDVSRASLGSATEAAIALQRDLGVEVGKTVEAFASLGRDPLKAVVSLNEKQNFLTLATYEQIKALTEQGRVAEAAAVAQDAYARAAISRSGEMRASLGLLERGWRGIKDGAAEAWDAMLGLGREKTVEQQLADVQRRLAEPVRRGGNTLQAEARREALRQREAELQEALRIEQRFTDKQARDAAEVRAKAEADARARARAGGSTAAAPEFGALRSAAEQYRQDFLRSEKLSDDQAAAEKKRQDAQANSEAQNLIKRQEVQESFLQSLRDGVARESAQAIEDQRARGEALIALDLEIARRRVDAQGLQGGARDEALRLVDEQALTGRRRLEVDLRNSGDKLAEDTGRELYNETRGAISAAFRESDRPLEAFGAALANTIFTRATSSLVNALATAAVGADGRGGGLGSLIQFIGSIAGGGMSIDTSGAGTIAPADARPRGGMATGTNYVPRNMLALVHQGEAIVPARYNPAAGGMAGSFQINNSPTINIEARTDQQQVATLVYDALAQNNTALVEDLQARGLIAA